MNENQLRERMHTAVLDEPPLGFDPDDLTDRAGRRQRQRRAVLGAATATLVLAAGAVTVGAVTQGGGRGVGSPTSVTPAPNCPQPMATLAPTVITRHIPGVTLDTYDVTCSQVDLQYLDPGTGQRIWLYREKNRHDPAMDFFANNEGAYHLVSETPVPGALVRAYTEAVNPDGYWLRAAAWVGTDNLVVWAEVGGRGEPMATEQQLIAMASDPELRN